MSDLLLHLKVAETYLPIGRVGHTKTQTRPIGLRGVGGKPGPH